MKRVYILVLSLLMVGNMFAQEKYLTKEGYVSFFSHSIVEDIKADNNQVVSVVDMETHKIAIQLLMRSFMFEKALMQEHFNENYIESHKYPKAVFSGEMINFNPDNKEVEIVGKLKLHGEEKEIKSMATVTVKPDEVIIKGDFKVKVADFNIKIPRVVVNNIAKTIKVSYELHHKPYK